MQLTTLAATLAFFVSYASAVPASRQANHCDVGGGKFVKIASSAGNVEWVYGSPESGVQLSTGAANVAPAETAAFRFETNGRGRWQISPVTDERYQIAVHYEQSKPLTLAPFELHDSSQWFNVLCDDCTATDGKLGSNCTIRPNVSGEPDCVVIRTAASGAFLDTTTCAPGTAAQTFDIVEL